MHGFNLNYSRKKNHGSQLLDSHNKNPSYCVQMTYSSTFSLSVFKHHGVKSLGATWKHLKELVPCRVNLNVSSFHDCGTTLPTCK